MNWIDNPNPKFNFDFGLSVQSSNTLTIAYNDAGCIFLDDAMYTLFLKCIFKVQHSDNKDKFASTHFVLRYRGLNKVFKELFSA
jgi:hypothetical protein